MFFVSALQLIIFRMQSLLLTHNGLHLFMRWLDQFEHGFLALSGEIEPVGLNCFSLAAIDVCLESVIFRAYYRLQRLCLLNHFVTRWLEINQRTDFFVSCFPNNSFVVCRVHFFMFLEVSVLIGSF